MFVMTDINTLPASPAEPAPADPPRRSLGVMAGVILSLLAGFALLDLLLQNSQHAHLHFLGWATDLTLSALVFATAFIAVVLDQMIGLIWRRRRRRLLNLEEGTARPRRVGRG